MAGVLLLLFGRYLVDLLLTGICVYYNTLINKSQEKHIRCVVQSYHFVFIPIVARRIITAKTAQS